MSYDCESAQYHQQDIYVIVSENDKPHTFNGVERFDDMGALVLEQYVFNSDLESIKKRAELMSERLGKCRIAKLQFIEE